MSGTSPIPLDVFVVVHGMGEQLQGNTVASLIQTFVAADGTLEAVEPLPVSRAFVVSRQDEQGFVLGREIPGCEKQLAEMAFAEVHWSDITAAEFQKTGVSFSDWSASLIRQLELRRQADNPEVASMICQREWIFPLLRVLRGGLNNVNYLLRPRLGWISDLAFNKYLGDVQMYAESPEARSQSRARFHQTFDKMHAKFKAQLPDRECRYHIIAHSLGTVLTLDAMLTAHVSKKVQEAHDSEKQRFLVEATGTALPLDQPGETGKLARLGHAIGLDEAQETTDGSKKFPWVLQIKTLFTLGSPIDKFLVVWDRNVRELTEGLDQSQLFHRDGERIQHFNFCDEQDPFGHRLNVMYETEGSAPSPIAPIAQRIFQRREDCVFSRYPQPIVAHTKYLSDAELVRWIRDEARTGSADPIKSEFLFDGGRFMQALGWNYFWIQTLTMSLLVFSLTAMSTAADWKTRLILAIPTAWSFWMILPEFLWLIAAWRVLVAGIRKPEEQRDRIWRQRFAMISSLFVDGLFVLSFPLVVALAIDSGQTGPGNGLWIVIGTVVAFLLILWKVVGLVARRTSPLQRKSVLSTILWFGMTLGLTLLVGFWKELPMFEGNAIDQWITSSVSGLLKLLPQSTGTLITHPRAYEFLIPISGAIAIAGTFDILIRAAATKYLRFKRVE